MFEEILNNHLRKCSDITSYLTKYDDEPAIFNQTAPDDMSDLWMYIYKIHQRLKQ